MQLILCKGTIIILYDNDGVHRTVTPISYCNLYKIKKYITHGRLFYSKCYGTIPKTIQKDNAYRRTKNVFYVENIF